MQTVLVTGATGCVGSSLVFLLRQSGSTVRALTRPGADPGLFAGAGAEVVQGDICDDAALARAVEGCDVVYHAAALVSHARTTAAEQHRVNVLGTRALVRACLHAGIGCLVHTSSVATIRTLTAPGEADESMSADRSGANSYSLSKIRAEDEVLEGIRAGLRAVIVNPSVIVGERDAHVHGGQIVIDIKRGRIPFYVAGGMNVVYVGDVAEGMIAAASRGRSGERYILAGENMTHEEIFRRTAALLGARPPLARLPLPILKGAAACVEAAATLVGAKPPLTRDIAASAGSFHWYSSAKAARELGFTASSFDRAVMAAYAWYQAHGYL